MGGFCFYTWWDTDIKWESYQQARLYSKDTYSYSMCQDSWVHHPLPLVSYRLASWYTLSFLTPRGILQPSLPCIVSYSLVCLVHPAPPQKFWHTKNVASALPSFHWFHVPVLSLRFCTSWIRIQKASCIMWIHLDLDSKHCHPRLRDVSSAPPFV